MTRPETGTKRKGRLAFARRGAASRAKLGAAFKMLRRCMCSSLSRSRRHCEAHLPYRPQRRLQSAQSAPVPCGITLMARFYGFGPFGLDARSDALVGPHGPVAVGQRACVLLRTLVSQPGVLVTNSEYGFIC